MRKTRIRIVETPDGSGIPEEVRREWVGLEFDAKGPKFCLLMSVTGPKKGFTVGRVYKVISAEAFSALKKKSEKAYTWFMENRFLNKLAEKTDPEKAKDLDTKTHLFFKTESCIEI